MAAVSSTVEDLLNGYGQAVKRNVGELREVVERSGARLLVMSEASSHLAPSGSFFRDLRNPFHLNGQALEWSAAAAFFSRMNDVYLSAAASAGADTLDLASRVTGDPEELGLIFYDTFHYTPAGCRRVAGILEPVILRRLHR